MNHSTPQYGSVPFPTTNSAPVYPQQVASTAFPQTTTSNMPAYMYPPTVPTANQYYTRPRAYSTSHAAYPQPVVYASTPTHHSHGSHGSHGRSHSHSRNHGHRSHSHSRRHSHDTGRRHRHHSSSHHGHGHHSSSPGYTYGNLGSNAAYYSNGGHSYPQVARVESRHSHNVLQYNPHHSHHSRRYSESGLSFGDRLRNFFSFGSSSRSPRGAQYLDTRTGRKVDQRGREIYRV